MSPHGAECSENNNMNWFHVGDCCDVNVLPQMWQ